MEYNDFNILEDYEIMAKEYYSSMQAKGYMFVRISENHQEKKLLSQNVINILTDILSGYKSIENFLSRTEREFLKRLYFLSQTQLDTLKDMYNISCDKKNFVKQNVKKVISKETLLLDKLLKLMFLEEGENFAIIKNMVFERLKILSENTFLTVFLRLYIVVLKISVAFLSSSMSNTFLTISAFATGFPPL